MVDILNLLCNMLNRDKRPIQIKNGLTDLCVDPISSIIADPSWTINDGKELQMPSVIGVISNIPEGGIDVGRNRLIHDGSHIHCTDMKDSKENDVGNMLCFYFAKRILRIDRGMTFSDLKKDIHQKFRLPVELELFMGSNEFDSDFLVVLTDLSDKKVKSLGLHISDRMKSEIAMFVPSDFFLRLFDKKRILDLYEGRGDRVFDIPNRVHDKLKGPILKSLELEVAEVKLHSVFPNWIVVVGTTKNKTFFVDGKTFTANFPIEPWWLDRLKRLKFVGEQECSRIGEGKRSSHGTSSKRMNM